MIDAYYLSLEGRLKSDPLTVKTFDTVRFDEGGGRVLDTYLILKAPTMGTFQVTAFSKEVDYSANVPFEVVLQAVGTSASNARRMLSRGVDRLVSFKVSAPDRQPTVMKVEDTSEIDPDESVKPFLYSGYARFSWISRPA